MSYRFVLLVLLLAFEAHLAAAQSPAPFYPYYEHIVFDNSLEPDAYFYSGGRASAPSTLKLVDGKLPVEQRIVHTPPNALRLEWTSTAEGGWVGGLEYVKFRDRPPVLKGSVLSFWCYAPEAIPGSELPGLRLETSTHFPALIS